MPGPYFECSSVSAITRAAKKEYTKLKKAYDNKIADVLSPLVGEGECKFAVRDHTVAGHQDTWGSSSNLGVEGKSMSGLCVSNRLAFLST